MIVFSATHQPTGRVFVGSCRVDLDFHWAMLVTQADEAVPGPLFDCLRADGVAAFDVAEYAEAETARELAELCREAAEELGGELIKAAPRPAKKTAVNTRQLLAEVTEDAAEDDDVDGWLADRRRDQERAAPAPSAPTQAAPTQAAPGSPVKAPSVTVAVDKPVLRNSRSTAEAADMKAVMAAIEARRLSQRKSPAKTPKKGTSAMRSVAAQATRAAKGESAAARERRIKAALAEQKAARLAEKEASVAAQADEMAAILNRLDERQKVTERVRRRR